MSSDELYEMSKKFFSVVDQLMFSGEREEINKSEKAAEKRLKDNCIVRPNMAYSHLLHLKQRNELRKRERELCM